MSAPAAEWSYAAKSGWVLMAALATAVGSYSLRYGLPHVPWPLLANFATRRASLSVHAVSASIALLVGLWQFLPDLRARRIGLHRALGRTYVAAVLVGWAASIPVGLHAETGNVASEGSSCWASVGWRRPAAPWPASFRATSGRTGDGCSEATP